MALERPRRRIDPLTAAVGVIVALTLVGLVVLWPPPVTSEEPAAEPLLPATITAIERLPDDEGMTMARLTFEITGGALDGTVNTTDQFLDGLPELTVGDRVRVIDSGTEGELFIADLERGPALWWLLALFVAVVLAVGRWQGLRSLLGLAVSLLLVTRFIVGGILAGESPALVALVGSMAVMLVTLYLAHGVSTRTSVAAVGTAVALAATVALGLYFIDAAAITGFSSEEARFAQVLVEDLDVAGLVLAGLIIAALGVLDDVTVAQAATVWALHDTDPDQDALAVFRTAMSVGRDHIASTVNTLFLAYAGASLALLVLLSTSGQPLGDVIRSETVATEVMKMLVGSLGLISAVPITTGLAALLVVRRPDHEIAASRRRAGHVPHAH